MNRKSEAFITIKVWLGTRRKLRQIAALTDKNMVEVVERLATRELKRLKKGEK